MLYGDFAYIILKSINRHLLCKYRLHKLLVVVDVTPFYVHKCETYNKKHPLKTNQLYNNFCYGKSYETKQLYKN